MSAGSLVYFVIHVELIVSFCRQKYKPILLDSSCLRVKPDSIHKIIGE